MVQPWRRMVGSMALALALASALAPAFARDFLTSDSQFTLCKWPDLKDCDLLDAKREEAFGFSAHEREILKHLRRFAEADHFTGQDMIDAFGKPELAFELSPGEPMFGWFYPEPGKVAKSSYGMVMSNKKLSVIRFNVPDRFTIFWYSKVD